MTLCKGATWMTSQPSSTPLLPALTPVNPYYLTPLWGPQGRHEEGSSPVPGRESRPIHLALARKVVGYQILYLLWNIWNIKYYLWDPVSLSPVSGLTTLPLLKAVEPSLCVNLPAIQAHHQLKLEQLVQYKIWKPSLKVTNTQHQPPAPATSNNEEKWIICIFVAPNNKESLFYQNSKRK